MIGTARVRAIATTVPLAPKGAQALGLSKAVCSRYVLDVPVMSLDWRSRAWPVGR
jgi:hypothetical protein